MEIIGTVAAILTTGAFIPQVIKTIKTRQTEDLSLTTFSMIFLGTILWAIYGFSIGDQPLLIANSLTSVMAAIILILKIKTEFNTTKN